ncbi:MAG: endolytic transglycosylase MltG [Clostridia bacterium]|nr:endolytic transglycosylase MltG [Clostridia bacterium]
MAKKRKKRGTRQRRPLFQSEKYSIRALHEDREYGMYWYAWLWKIVRPLLIFLCSALMVIGMVSVGYDRVYNAFFAPVSADSAEVVTFQIDDGETVTQIGARLQAANLLRDSRVFKYMVQFRGLTNALSYGTFKLSPGMNTGEIIDELTSGSQTNERVITIVPGWTAEDIAKYLVDIGALEDTGEFLRLCNDVDRFVGSSYALRDAQNHGALQGRKYALEGYLAPDTYRIFVSATAESIIRTLLNQHNKVVDNVFYADHSEYYTDEAGVYHEVEKYNSTLTMDQTVTLASMIEKEAANREDYARVSAVFHNRLAQGMKLESDPTVTYLSGEHKLALSDEEIAQQNAYNTYFMPALPAGPICNPSAAALEAAMLPDMEYIKDGYLYFCATEPNSGKLAFSVSKAEHEANVALYRPLWEEYDRQQAAKQTTP